MSVGSKIAWDDTILPFQLDASDIRGRVVRLDGVLDQILSQHDYPSVIEALVAEVALITALIGQSIKLRWKLSVQIRGDGPARIVAADYYAPQAEGETARMRAYASFDAERLAAEQGAAAAPVDLIGKGYFAILIDQGPDMVPYQGITPLTGAPLVECAQTYFAQSEQLATRFALAFGQSQAPGEALSWRAGGVMLQHLPDAEPLKGDAEASSSTGLLSSDDILDGARAENWTRVNTLLNTVEEMELVGPHVQPTEMIYRLFHEEQPRVYDPQVVRFGCGCSADRVRDAMSIYSAKDIRSMTTAEGMVTADCQFCGAHYELDPATLGFEADQSPDAAT